MEMRKIETEEDFAMAMGAVQSSIQLLDMFDWDHWLREEALFQTAGPISDPTLYKAMQDDPQWDIKVGIMRAGATYMKSIRELRARLENPHES